MSEETVTFNLEINAENAADQLREVNDLFTTYLALANRAGLRGDIMDALRKLQQMRIALQLTLRAIELFEAASGPLGWAMALGTAGTAFFTIQNSVYEVHNR